MLCRSADGGDLVGDVIEGDGVHDLVRLEVEDDEALAQDADLLLLDEPTSGLDDASRRAAASALRVATGRGAAVVGVTHDLGVLGEVDEVVTLAEGRIGASVMRGRSLDNVSSVEG